jgi:predicted metal-dependent hydrolase
METTSRLPIVVRKPELRLAEAPRYYLHGGNALATHFFNALNLLFPDGERFFVKSVHDHLALIEDAALREDARAFAAQEGQHAREHEAFFAVLEGQGYDFQEHLRTFRRFSRWGSKHVPAALRLSLTAGAEHYTATLGALALECDLLHDCDDTMRELITWHAIEEIEHKAVAFDVLRATHPGYFLRVLGFVIATLCIGFFTARGVVLFVKHDRIRRTERERLRRELHDDPNVARFHARLGPALRAYLRPGFHPNDVRDRHLVERFVPGIRFSTA